MTSSEPAFRSQPDLPGETLQGRYQIVQALGRRAGRRTFLAQDLTTGQRVVVKLLLFNRDFNWDDLKLFEREAEILQVLSHPAIPQYLDAFHVDSPDRRGFALVQSYLDAPSLATALQADRPWPEADLRQLAASLLEILTYLHQQSPPVIHRDIKPSNVLVRSPAEAYLVDFGSVQTLASQEGRTITVVGTYGYMPPEQFGGRAVPASDLYSLGVTLITLATGLEPTALPQQKLRLQFAGLTDLSPNFTAWLQWLTDPNLEQRAPSAAVALQVLQQRREVPLSVGERSPISTWRLLVRALAESMSMGAAMGSLFGGIFGTSMFPVFGTVAGAILGGGVGAPLGIVNGLLITGITRLWFYPVQNIHRYQSTLMLVSIVIGTVLSAFLLSCSVVVFFLPDTSLLVWWATMLIPGTIAGLTMGKISHRIARWYCQTTSQPPWGRIAPGIAYPPGNSQPVQRTDSRT